MAENVRRLHPEEDKSFRLAPHNVEAEQALLGAVLVNNEAFYRVSDFLIPDHFYEPIHREIYEVLAKVIRAGRTATPITLKTHLPEALTAEMSMPQYLARLAAEATTVLNAADYGQTIYDLAIRRNLIQIGEEMVSTAYHSDVEETANKQIEEAEKQLFDLAEKGRYDGGFQPFNEALKQAITMAGEAYSRDGTLSGTATGLSDLDRLMGGLQRSDLIILAARPAMGKTSLATNIAFHVAKHWKGDVTPDGHKKTVDGGQVGLLLARNERRAAGNAYSGRAGRNLLIRHPARQYPREPVLAAGRRFQPDGGGAALYRRHRRHFGAAASGAGATPEAAEGTRPADRRLFAAPHRLVPQGQREPRAGADRDHHDAQGAGQGAGSADHRAQPALPSGGKHATTSTRSSPTCVNRARSSRTPTWVLFVYREEYYLKNKEPKEGTPEHLAWQGEMEQVHGKAEVIIGKQRHGPTGTVQLSFEAQYTRFGNLAKADYLPERME